MAVKNKWAEKINGTTNLGEGKTRAKKGKEVKINMHMYGGETKSGTQSKFTTISMKELGGMQDERGELGPTLKHLN